MSFPFHGIDMIVMIEPKASNGHHFILVAIDYFIKWVEAASYANVTKQVVVRFIKNQIIYRYGVPSKIILIMDQTRIIIWSKLFAKTSRSHIIILLPTDLR